MRYETVDVRNIDGKIVRISKEDAPVYKARYAESEYTRALWLRKIDYQTNRILIRGVLRREISGRAALEAINRLDPTKDIDIIKKIAGKALTPIAIYQDPTMMARATGKLIYENDRELLRDLAVCEVWEVRSIAVAKLHREKDHDILEIALTDARHQVRTSAQEVLGLQKTL